MSAAIPLLTSVGSRGAPASASSQAGPASGAETGFAGLFTQFSARTIDAQAEPTALPSLQDALPAAGTALDDTLTEDSTVPADSGLLAALGLLPLPGMPEPLPAGGTLFGSLAIATPSTDTAEPTSSDSPLVAASGASAAARTLLTTPAATPAAALAGAINASFSRADANTHRPAAAPHTQAALSIATTATASLGAASATTAIAPAATAAAPVLAALVAAASPIDAAPDAAAASLETSTSAPPAINLATASRPALAGPAGVPTPDVDTAVLPQAELDSAAVLKLSTEILRTDTKTDHAGSRIAAPGSALSFDRADLLSALRDSVTLPASLNPPPSAALDPRSAGFGVTLGQQMVWLAEQKVGRAEIRLDPEELGPLEVSLELNGDEVRAEFGSRSAEVRSLLESQVPRLREMLAEHGFSLADAQIGQERHAQQQSFAGSGGADGRSTGAGIDANDSSQPATTAARVRQGLVDDYA